MNLYSSRRSTAPPAFTIIELLVVIIIIAILAAITAVAYTGIQSRAKQSAAQSSAQQGYTKIVAYAVQNSDQYPADLAASGLSSSGGANYEYDVNNSSSPRTFCLTATVSGISYYVSNSVSQPTSGLCAGHTGGGPIADGSFIQTITSTNCPSSRVRAVDARDNHTYWV